MGASCSGTDAFLAKGLGQTGEQLHGHRPAGAPLTPPSPPGGGAGLSPHGPRCSSAEPHVLGDTVALPWSSGCCSRLQPARGITVPMAHPFGSLQESCLVL